MTEEIVMTECIEDAFHQMDNGFNILTPEEEDMFREEEMAIVLSDYLDELIAESC